MGPIVLKSFAQQSHLFAKISNITYKDLAEAKEAFESLGFEPMFFSKGSSQAYLLFNETDMVLSCRGTQPTELGDIEDDLDAILVKAPFGSGRVHKGFKDSLDNLWEEMYRIVQVKYDRHHVWCTGHSLGAAMTVLLSQRMQVIDELPTPMSIFTYGCPRPGDREHVEEIKVPHYRWVNNADIVTTVPPWPYHHHGEICYLNHWGNVRVLTRFQRMKDRIRGFLKGIREGRINYFHNHSIDNYEAHLERYAQGIEADQK